MEDFLGEGEKLNIPNDHIQLVDRIGVLMPDGSFIMGEEWKLCLKEIIMNLRRDSNETLKFIRTLGYLNIMESKLIPLGLSYRIFNTRNIDNNDVLVYILKIFYYFTLPPENILIERYIKEVEDFQRKCLAKVLEKVFQSNNI